MPSAAAAALQQSPRLRAVNQFLRRPQYVFIVGLMSLMSNILGLELFFYGICTGICVYTLLLGEDLLPMTPLAPFCYIAPSVSNNPGINDNSVFSGWRGIFVLVYAGVILVACLYRLIRDRQQFFSRKYKLLPGILLLWCGYLLGGIGSPGYGDKAMRHLFFAFLQGVSIGLLYVLFAGGIRWENVRRDYFAWIGFSMGCVLFCQIAFIYLQPNTVIDGVIYRENIYTGWGIHNNMGGMLAMMIPFPFYIATRYRKGWLGTVTGSIFMLGVILSCSRNAILISTALYFAGIVLMLYYARNRRGNTIAALSCLSIVLLVAILFGQQLLQLFSNILSLGFDPNSRDSIYGKGIQLFKENPIFGGSFFAPEELSPWGWSTAGGFTDFFPARWHNTIVQLLASCGIVGLICYLPHRIQVIGTVVRQRNKENVFIGCSIMGLLLCSLFDCHFFNIGPTLFYSIALAFLENYKHKS